MSLIRGTKLLKIFLFGLHFLTRIVIDNELSSPHIDSVVLLLYFLAKKFGFVNVGIIVASEQDVLKNREEILSRRKRSECTSCPENPVRC